MPGNLRARRGDRLTPQVPPFVPSTHRNPPVISELPFRSLRLAAQTFFFLRSPVSWNHVLSCLLLASSPGPSCIVFSTTSSHSAQAHGYLHDRLQSAVVLPIAYCPQKLAHGALLHTSLCQVDNEHETFSLRIAQVDASSTGHRCKTNCLGSARRVYSRLINRAYTVRNSWYVIH